MNFLLYLILEIKNEFVFIASGKDEIEIVKKERRNKKRES